MTVYCQQCDYEADGLLDYENHMRWHEAGEPVECSTCGDTETVELHHPTKDQSVTVCATCGSDE